MPSTRCSRSSLPVRSPHPPTRRTLRTGRPSPGTSSCCRARSGRRRTSRRTGPRPTTAPSAAETHARQQRRRRDRGGSETPCFPRASGLRDGEILILVRRRDAFAAAMNRALRNRQIPTAGADRIPVVDPHRGARPSRARRRDASAGRRSSARGAAEEPAARLDRRRADAARGEAASAACGARFSDATDERVCKRAAEKLRAWRKMADQVTPFRFFATMLGPDGGRQGLSRASRRRGRRRARHVSEPGACLRDDGSAVAAGLRPLHPRQRERHQARGRGRGDPACGS